MEPFPSSYLMRQQAQPSTCRAAPSIKPGEESSVSISPVSRRKVIPMTTSQQTILLLDQTREAGPNKHVQGVMTIQDIARLGSGDPTTGQNGSNSHPSE